MHTVLFPSGTLLLVRSVLSLTLSGEEGAVKCNQVIAGGYVSEH